MGRLALRRRTSGLWAAAGIIAKTKRSGTRIILRSEFILPELYMGRGFPLVVAQRLPIPAKTTLGTHNSATKSRRALILTPTLGSEWSLEIPYVFMNRVRFWRLCHRAQPQCRQTALRSEEHTSELQSLR